MRPLRATALASLCLTLCAVLPVLGQTVAAAPKHTDAAADNLDLVPRYLLKDHRGRVVTQDSFRGRFQLVTFGFTSCPDVCPTTLLGIRNILEAMGDKATRLQPLFITVDPERDTADLLKEYTGVFHPAIIGLRGSPELLQRAAESFRVRYEKVREPGAAADIYTMDHSTGMYLLDGDGRFVVKFSMNAPAPEIAARIRALMDADHSRPGTNKRGNAPLR